MLPAFPEGEWMGDFSRDSGGETERGAPSEPSSALHPLADELMAIAAQLRAVSSSPNDLAGTSQAATERRAKDGMDHFARARRAYFLRRKRDAIFSETPISSVSPLGISCSTCLSLMERQSRYPYRAHASDRPRLPPLDYAGSASSLTKVLLCGKMMQMIIAAYWCASPNAG